MAPKLVDKKAKKIAILEAAMKIFAKKGIRNTKMIDIAKVANIEMRNPGSNVITPFLSAMPPCINQSTLPLLLLNTEDGAVKLQLPLHETFCLQPNKS